MGSGNQDCIMGQVCSGTKKAVSMTASSRKERSKAPACTSLKEVASISVSLQIRGCKDRQKCFGLTVSTTKEDLQRIFHMVKERWTGLIRVLIMGRLTSARGKEWAI